MEGTYLMALAVLQMHCQHCGRPLDLLLNWRRRWGWPLMNGWMVWWTSGLMLCPTHSKGVVY